jgi:hypothetical protein
LESRHGATPSPWMYTGKRDVHRPVRGERQPQRSAEGAITVWAEVATSRVKVMGDRRGGSECSGPATWRSHPWAQEDCESTPISHRFPADGWPMKTRHLCTSARGDRKHERGQARGHACPVFNQAPEPAYEVPWKEP